MRFQTILIVVVLLLQPSIAAAHLGGLEVTLPLSSIAAGMIVGGASLLLAADRRVFPLLVVGAAMLLLLAGLVLFWSEIAGSRLALVGVFALAFVLFAAGFGLTLLGASTMRRHWATLRRLRFLSRRS